MARTKTEFVCTACGGVTPKWQGQCPDCGAWNTLEETTRAPTAPGKGRAGLAARSTVQTLDQVSLEEEARQRTHSTELDRVLGGGLVNGAVVLLGGDPGIGKSTLLLQTLSNLARDHAALYVTGEESLQQVALRASRLGLPRDRLEVLAETSVEAMLATAEARRPRVMVVDSVQTVFTEALQSAPGSVSQVRDSAAQLVRYAKRSGTALFLVGHVTKEGALAGPRVLEHMVDTVLYFESDSGSRFRLLRAVKNRFGAANELGVFAMLEEGLKEVRNPSAIFLSRHEEAVPGSLVTVTREGSRPLMVEVQALVADSPLSNPRRVAVGLDGNRLSLLLAVLARHGGVALHGLDVFLNVVGGVRVSETASDLPAVLAVLSSLRDRPLPLDTVVFGELGLSGEIRPVPNGEERLVEAAKHGFRRAVVPRKNRPRKPPEGLEVIGVERLQEAMEAVF
ncbi:DNA repair protein RadA [Alkalilimnicola ehrlichii]|uniref:DNA repair protein RadA n=1 Tax=Alkalilimnicola ehrlichii TaxID=351052 RepID=UPI003BA072AF